MNEQLLDPEEIKKAILNLKPLVKPPVPPIARAMTVNRVGPDKYIFMSDQGFCAHPISHEEALLRTMDWMAESAMQDAAITS